MHMSPLTSSPRSSRHSFSKSASSPGFTPAFCGSSPVLTCTNSSGRRPCRAISCAIARAIFGRSMEWIASNNSTASRALFDCNGPIRCSATSGKGAQRRPLRLRLLHAVFPEHAMARLQHGDDHLRIERLRHDDELHRRRVAARARSRRGDPRPHASEPPRRRRLDRLRASHARQP